jgi:hypothetical protein
MDANPLFAMFIKSEGLEPYLDTKGKMTTTLLRKMYDLFKTPDNNFKMKLNSKKQDMVLCLLPEVAKWLLNTIQRPNRIHVLAQQFVNAYMDKMNIKKSERYGQPMEAITDEDIYNIVDSLNPNSLESWKSRLESAGIDDADVAFAAFFVEEIMPQLDFWMLHNVIYPGLISYYKKIEELPGSQQAIMQTNEILARICHLISARNAATLSTYGN